MNYYYYVFKKVNKLIISLRNKFFKKLTYIVKKKKCTLVVKCIIINYE